MTGGEASRRAPCPWSGWRGALAVVLVAGLIIVSVVLVARFAGWTRGPLAFLVALVPWWTLAAGVATVALLILRRWTLALVGMIVAAVGLATLQPLLVAQTAPVGAADAVTVMSVNMTKGAADAESIVALAREREVDVLAVQEITPQGEDLLRSAGVDEVLPRSFVVAEPGALGTGLWSRTPLSSQRQLDGFVFRQLVAVTRIAGELVTVVSAHPRPPSSRLSGRWRDEQQRLLAEVSTIQGPALLVGDLNATSDHPELRELQRRGWQESRDQAGAGPVFTYPTVTLPFPIAALDRAYVKGLGWVASMVEALDVPGADHRAIVVTYRTPSSAR